MLDSPEAIDVHTADTIDDEVSLLPDVGSAAQCAPPWTGPAKSADSYFYGRTLSAMRLSGCVCLLLQYLVQSCSRGGRGIVDTANGFCTRVSPRHCATSLPSLMPRGPHAPHRFDQVEDLPG